MTRTTDALRRLEAVPCPACRGHGHTRGLFHALPCMSCAATGYLQRDVARPIDTLAAEILAAAIAGDRHDDQVARMTRPDTGTPDNWILRNRFRGD